MKKKKIIFEKSEHNIELFGEQFELYRVANLTWDDFDRKDYAAYLMDKNTGLIYIISRGPPTINFKLNGINNAQSRCKSISIKFKKREFNLPESVMPSGLERAVLGKCRLDGCELPGYIEVDFATMSGETCAGYVVGACTEKHAFEYRQKECDNRGTREYTREKKRDYSRACIILKAES